MPLQVTEQDFLSEAQVKSLKTYLKRQAKYEEWDGRRAAVRDWMILHLALDTGLRVSELCDLKVADVALNGERSSLLVRCGKGGKRRSVRLGDAVAKHLAKFLRHKQETFPKQSIEPEAPLFVSLRCRYRKGRPLTRTALWRVFKIAASAAGLPSRFSIHSCRHAYATFLYAGSSYNLRLVQLQLGHSSIQTTQVYADVLDKDLGPAVNSLPQ